MTVIALICLSIPIIPAFLLMIFSLRNLRKPQNNLKSKKFIEVLWLLPMYILIGLAWAIASGVIFGDTGNGSKMAAYSVIYDILVTLAAGYGYLTTVTKSFKGLVYRWLLILAGFIIFLPFMVFCIQIQIIFLIETLKSW